MTRKAAHPAGTGVAPLVGAWIEILESIEAKIDDLSLPSWERGLKLTTKNGDDYKYTVAPLVGAWIEIWSGLDGIGSQTVAPLVGAWIEIKQT